MTGNASMKECNVYDLHLEWGVLGASRGDVPEVSVFGLSSLVYSVWSPVNGLLKYSIVLPRQRQLFSSSPFWVDKYHPIHAFNRGKAAIKEVRSLFRHHQVERKGSR